jgi:hypothetical protein
VENRKCPVCRAPLDRVLPRGAAGNVEVRRRGRRARSAQIDEDERFARELYESQFTRAADVDVEDVDVEDEDVEDVEEDEDVEDVEEDEDVEEVEDVDEDVEEVEFEEGNEDERGAPSTFWSSSSRPSVRYASASSSWIGRARQLHEDAVWHTRETLIRATGTRSHRTRSIRTHVYGLSVSVVLD